MFFLTAFSVRKVVSLFGTINHRDTSAVVTSQQKIITKKYLILIRCKQTCVTNGYSLGNLLIKAVKEMFSKSGDNEGGESWGPGSPGSHNDVLHTHKKELLWKKSTRERVICAGGRAEMGREPPGQSKEARGNEEEPTVSVCNG